MVIGALDSSDAHHAEARRRFEAWEDAGEPRLIALMNLSEVLVAHAGDGERLAQARDAVAALGIRTHVPNEVIAVDAARLRGRHPVSLPDAYALASARHAGATLISFDRKLQQAARREKVG